MSFTLTTAQIRDRTKTVYIDRALIRHIVGTTHPIRTMGVLAGELVPGEREYVRKRLANFISDAMPREIRRAPAEICLAVAEIAASGLMPCYPKIVDGHKADVTMERITQLFTKTAIAVGI